MKTLNTSLRTSKSQKKIIIASSLLALIVLSMLSLSLGRVSIAIEDILKLIFGQSVPATTQHVIVQLRLPRLLGAIVAGAALAISGSIY